MKNNSISIVTIAFKNIDELFGTLISIDNQSEKPYENILILSGFDNKEKDKITKAFTKPFRQFHWDIDNSLFNAMNEGIKKSNGSFILFMNAGDKFSNYECLKLAKSSIIDKSCYSFKTLQVFEDIAIIRENVPKEGFFGMGYEKNLPPHQGFFAPNEKKIFFNEQLKVSADNDWMKKNIIEYGIHYSSEIIAKFRLGGQSTYPTIYIIYVKLRYEKFLRFIIECLKYTYSFFVTRKIYFITMAKLRGYKIIKE